MAQSAACQAEPEQQAVAPPVEAPPAAEEAPPAAEEAPPAAEEAPSPQRLHGQRFYSSDDSPESLATAAAADSNSASPTRPIGAAAVRLGVAAPRGSILVNLQERGPCEPALVDEVPSPAVSVADGAESPSAADGPHVASAAAESGSLASLVDAWCSAVHEELQERPAPPVSLFPGTPVSAAAAKERMISKADAALDRARMMLDRSPFPGTVCVPMHASSFAPGRAERPVVRARAHALCPLGEVGQSGRIGARLRFRCGRRSRTATGRSSAVRRRHRASLRDAQGWRTRRRTALPTPTRHRRYPPGRGCGSKAHRASWSL